MAQPDLLAQNAASRLHKLFDDEQAWELRNYPEAGTFLGFPGYNDRWTDRSLSAIEQRNRHPAEVLRALEAIPRAELSADDQLNYDLFHWRVSLAVESAKFPEEFLTALDPLEGGLHAQIAETLKIAPTKTVKDYEDTIARLNAVPQAFDQEIALLKAGLGRGVTQPKIVLRDVPKQVDVLLNQEPSQSVMLKAFEHFPDSIPAAEQDRLRRAASAALDGKVFPALRKYRDYLVNTYIPGCRETIGLSSLPNGQDWYRYRLLRYTTTHLAPEEIHAKGMAEVERIHAAMEQVIASTGFKGSFAEFVAKLRSDPQFYFTKPEDLVESYRDICKRIDEQLPRLFGKLPRTPYGVEPIDAYYAPSQTTAFYEPGPVDGSRAGTYRVNTYRLDQRPKFEMEVLSSHESVPGHHLQIALAHEMQDVPEFRREMETTAFVEGWGLYSESLGYEIGLYKDPYSRFGQLSYDMWRACRLVVDTGMHAMGWSRQRAIDFMKANTALTEQNITVEVDRYISWPGQADAYKIGQLKIRELRTKAEHELGVRFDERAFHDVVLGAGAIPLEVLETRVDAWIAKQGAAS